MDAHHVVRGILRRSANPGGGRARVRDHRRGADATAAGVSCSCVGSAGTCCPTAMTRSICASSGALHSTSCRRSCWRFAGSLPAWRDCGSMAVITQRSDVRIRVPLLQEARAKLARQQVKSERPGHTAGAFAFCGTRTRFVARGCVREGLLGWASRAATPSAWPTVACVPADCLSAHRESSRARKSLVHDSRGRNARTHKQPRCFGRNPHGAEAAEGGSLG